MLSLTALFSKYFTHSRSAALSDAVRQWQAINTGTMLNDNNTLHDIEIKHKNNQKMTLMIVHVKIQLLG